MLQNFSRLDEAKCKPVDIREGIENALFLLQARLNNRPERSGIQVIKEHEILLVVKCYFGQLNQVFMNILNEAIEALEKAYISESGDDLWLITYHLH